MSINSLAHTPARSRPIRVLIVDDSLLIQRLLTRILSQDPALEVVGVASDPYEAREKIKQLNPDVLTLDIEMPRMDGIQFLRNLMRLRPMPVVMVSSLTHRNAQVTLDALALGAVDFVTKPQFNVVEEMESYAGDLIRKVKMAARAKIRGPAKEPATKAAPPEPGGRARAGDERPAARLAPADKIIAIGSSTGGTEALKAIFTALPALRMGFVITQHIPPAFSRSFAQRLDSICALHVKEAEEGDVVHAGQVLIAPGSHHLRLEKGAGRLRCRLDDSAPVNCHKPSVEVMFDSLGQFPHQVALAIMLTGMGDDGADAMGRLHDKGVRTIAQDEASSVVWGMPGQAVKRGHVDQVAPLEEMPRLITETARRLGLLAAAH